MGAIKERESNFELLRIISILGVIMLHYINPNMGGGLNYTTKGSLNYYILILVTSINVCAVNLFILISGYFMCENNTRTIRKPLELVVQVIIFSVGIYFFRCIIGNNEFSIKKLMSSLIPSNYFVILYIVLYLISPYINIVVNNLDSNKQIYMIVICLGALSVYPTLVDVFDVLTGTNHNGLNSIGLYGSQSGYTIVNFMLMYTIGAVIRKSDFKMSRVLKIVTLSLSILLITGWSIFDQQTAWAYCNPVVIIEAVALFMCFKDMSIKPNRLINSISKSVFSVFLLHTVFLGYIKIEQTVNKHWAFMLIHILGSSIVIFLVCYIVHMIYAFVTKFVLKKDIYKWTV